MQDRRKHFSVITPAYEDSGLFKSNLRQVLVELVPQTSRNARQDLVIRGFFGNQKEVAVTFAGRRMKDALPLETHLKTMWKNAVHTASLRSQERPTFEDVRFPVMIEGVWRPRFQRDITGWETRSYQLIAARWAVVDKIGQSFSYGEPPAN